MIKRPARIDLLVDGRNIATEGKEIELKVDGITVYNDNIQKVFAKISSSADRDFEEIDLILLMRVVNAVFGHPDRFKMTDLLSHSPKTFTELQNCLNLKPATLDFHIKKLQNELIISKSSDRKKYELTLIGAAVLEYFLRFLRKIE